MDLSKITIEDLKKEISKRETVDLEEALRDTLYTGYGFFGSHKQLAKEISKGISKRSLHVLINQLRWYRTEESQINGAPEFVELDEYTQQVSTPEGHY